MSKKKIYGIDLIRIFACISVYTHHYLGMELEPSKAGFYAFRSSAVYRNLLGVFGAEYAVIFFFVLAGFFMSYNTEPKAMRPLEYGKKCAFKCMNIIIPSFLIITVTALISMPLKAVGAADIFSLKDYFYDVFKLIIGKQGDKFIHYAYPLWFQHFIFTGYICGYIFLYIFRSDPAARLAAYFPALIYLLFNSEYVFMVFMGMLAGELCSERYEKKLRKLFGSIYINILFIAALSFAMSRVMEDHYDIPRIYGPATLFAAVFVLVIYCMSTKTGEKKHETVDFLSSHSYSCYLIHFFWICSFMRIVYRVSSDIPYLWDNSAIGCALMYVIMTVSLWAAGALFTEYVLKPLRGLYDRIWDGLQAGLSR